MLDCGHFVSYLWQIMERSILKIWVYLCEDHCSGLLNIDMAQWPGRLNTWQEVSSWHRLPVGHYATKAQRFLFSQCGSLYMIYFSVMSIYGSHGEMGQSYCNMFLHYSLSVFLKLLGTGMVNLWVFKERREQQSWWHQQFMCVHVKICQSVDDPNMTF